MTSVQKPGPDPLLSLVIPVYNEEEVLGLMRQRLDAVLGKLSYRAEVILVDDGSRDRSAELMRRFAAEDPRYKALILSRNYGHQLALTAGLDHAAGDLVVVLDADLQDPPEIIPEMIERWKEGYQVVYGERTNRYGESWPKRISAQMFYKLIRRMSGVRIPINVGDFRLMDRVVVDALKKMPEHYRFVRGMVAWLGFRQTPVPFARPARAAGVTKYPWVKMMGFALDAIFSFSVIPLRLALGVGLIVMSLSAFEIARTLYLRFVVNAVIPGFTSIFIGVLFLGGLNLVTLGILGEYIGRIYVESKNRPLYLVQEWVAPPGSGPNVQSRQ